MTFVYIFVFVMLAAFVAKLGEKRRIGSTYSLLLSLTLSPLFGFIITVISPSLKDERAYNKNSETNKVIGIISYILSGLIIVAAIYRYFHYKEIFGDTYQFNYWPSVIMAAGFLIFGDYLYTFPIPKKPENIPITNSTNIKFSLSFITKPFRFSEKKDLNLRKYFLFKRVVLFIVVPVFLWYLGIWYRTKYIFEINPILGNSVPPLEDWLSILLLVSAYLFLVIGAIMLIAFIIEVIKMPKFIKEQKTVMPKKKINMPIFKKRFWITASYIIGIIILALIFTNPSIKRFKDFVGQSSYSELKRKKNFLIFSIYEDRNDNEYIGILLNFFERGK